VREVVGEEEVGFAADGTGERSDVVGLAVCKGEDPLTR